MIKNLLLTLTLIVVAAEGRLSAQDKVSSHAFYAELGGAGILTSANIDGRFNSASHLGLGYRVGLGFSFYNETKNEVYVSYDGCYYSNDTYEKRVKSYATIPFGINYLLGKPNSPHTLEVEAGGAILTKKMSIWDYDRNPSAGYILGHVSVMYRRQPFDGGVMWKIGLHTIIDAGGDITPWPSVAVGYAF